MAIQKLIEIAKIGFNENFREPNFDEYIKESKKEILYEPHRAGFYLMNEDIRTAYWSFYGWGINAVELWFLKTKPKFSFISQNTDMKKFPNSLNCDWIRIHSGDIACFSFPLYISTENTIDIVKKWMNDHSSTAYFIKSDNFDMEEFKKGTKLMTKTAEKYDLKKFYKKFEK